jgi:transcription-repair coupling factor (superfamily II helicase)
VLKNSDLEIKELIIFGIDPQFADKPVFWFKENEETTIKNLNKRWVRKNILKIDLGKNLSFAEIQKKLYELNYDRVFENLRPGEYLIQGGLIKIFPLNKLSAYTLEFSGSRVEKIWQDKEILSEEQRKILLKQKFNDEFNLKTLEKLKSGDFVVHQDHGIGRFLKYEEQTFNQETKKYFIIQYAAPRKDASPDTLFVPTLQARKISRYLGFARPKINRLGTQTWHKTIAHIKEEALKFAQELLEIYAKREMIKRPPYQIDENLLKDVSARFEFEETPDQILAIENIKNDLQKNIPMDRLVCGDVGFGKTEVALQAAVMAVGAGKQVAMLCPTTILADQHFKTFSSRLDPPPPMADGGLGITVGLISRFESKLSQKKTIEALKKGSLDIVIGTHRLLSKDILSATDKPLGSAIKNLGLLIIDEEQRFGVKQKESFKKMRSLVDILSLSATPIPRTLSLSLTHIRDLSLIQTPPPGRQSIETIVSVFDTKIVKEAIKNELARNGQIFYLHNRIDTIENAAEKLKKMMPDLRLAIAHGRQSEKELRGTIEDFREHKFDLLLATTIIENGLDLSNANTLIVDDTTRLGLAQAYQIRGRIGRSKQKAHAYFLYPAKKLTTDQKARLETLEEFQEIGSGFYVSQKDLEIRGPGNILGKEQSGNVARVGFNLYCQLIADAVEKLKNKNPLT